MKWDRVLCASSLEESKAAFTPKWQITQGTPLENVHLEIYEAFHTGVARHVACTKLRLDATPRWDLFFCNMQCTTPGCVAKFNGAFTSKVIISKDNIKNMTNNITNQK